MKIVHLATVASSHRYLLLPQLQALVDDGHEVVAVSAAGADVPVLERAGVRHVALEGSTRGFDVMSDIRALRSFVTILRRERPDVVHTHNPKPGIYGRIAARLAGVPHVVNTVHGLYATPADPLARRAVVYGLEAIASRFSHLELVQNVEDVDLMRRTPLAPTAKIRLLGNGIDITRFRSDLPPEQREAVRAELGITPDAVAVVSVGRLVVEKGFVELFEASALLPDPYVLVVIGPDDPEKADGLGPDVLAAARERGVRFLGHRSDIERLLPAMDVFALASYREGLPRAAMEAAACGLPIVATNIRGCRQVVDHGVTGLLVPRAEVAPLADALGQLVADASLRRQLGKAARAKAEEDFDERLVVERLRSAYHERGIVGGERSPAGSGRP
jgi:glycosyltransferase involved in cell wall biosynthesis